MNNRLYDPWDDAALLADRGQSPQYRLVIVLGAGWCSKCQAFKALFEQQAQHTPPEYLPIWLDLEEHAEFIGDYLPENLPELLVYRAGALVKRAFLEDAGQFNECLHAPEQRFSADSVPPMAGLLIRQDWCRGEP